MLPTTRFTELVGCRLPIQQSGMGSVSTPELAAAVASVGALGMLGAAGLSAADLDAAIHRTMDLAGGGRFGVNFLMPFLDIDAFDVAARTVPLVECFYGDPDPALVERAHAAGALLAWQVGSVEEGIAARDAGCDIVVAQGVEAGGHVRGSRPRAELVAALSPVLDLPIVAAGGIGTGRVVAGCLAAGADGVRIGTCLLATPEADVHPQYAQALIAAGPDDTVLTEAFALGWPGAPHRVLKSCVDADGGARSPVPPTRTFTADVGTAALYAGMAVDHVRTVHPAAHVIHDLVTDAVAVLSLRDPH